MKVLMDKYITLISIYLKVYRKYPLELFLKLVYLPVQMLMYVFLWKALLQHSEMELNYMISYYLFVVLLSYAFPFAHIALDVQQDVEEGTIANYLVRPINYLTPIISKYIAWLICYSVIFVPAVIFVVIYRCVEMTNIMYFIGYICVGVFVEFLLWYNIGLLSLKMERIRGVMTAFRAFRTLASGALVPLYLFPTSLRCVVEILPLRLYMYTPIDALLNGQTIRTFGTNIVLAFVWSILLLLLSVLQWRAGLKKLQTNIS